MHHPPRPCYPPDREPFPQESDAALAASLRTPSWSTDPRPLGVLLERHWQPVHDYAALCTDLTGGHPAALAAAALHQVLRSLGQSGPTVALRPQLLMTVRHTAEAWALDRHWTRPAAGPRGAAPGLAIARDRRLALISFCSLSPAGQCLLWHTSVEAEPVSVPAALLALDTGSALTELEVARGQFRSELLRTHAERAEHSLCRLYNRLLDAQTRRGRTLLPDVRQHLLGCPDCAAAAEQLGTFERRLGELLAQAVLGRPATDYLSSRPGRPDPGSAGQDPAQPAPRGGRRSGQRGVPSGAAGPGGATGAPPRGYTRALLTGVGLASALALGAAVTTTLWPVGSATRAGSAAPGGAVPRPGHSGARPAAPPRVTAAEQNTAPTSAMSNASAEGGPGDDPALDPETTAGLSCKDTAGRPHHEPVERGGSDPLWMREPTGLPTGAAPAPATPLSAGAEPPGSPRPSGPGTGLTGTGLGATGWPDGTGAGLPGTGRPTSTGEGRRGSDGQPGEGGPAGAPPGWAGPSEPGGRRGAGVLPSVHPQPEGASGPPGAVRPCHG